MGLRLRSIRQKILLLVLVPVISLVGLYIFATVITARDAINLARTDTLKNATGLPVGVFLTTLDSERPLALVYLSRPTDGESGRAGGGRGPDQWRDSSHARPP